MAHEITIRENNFAEMAFVGNTPWHGLGQELDQKADIEAWRKAAGMDWTIESSPVMFEANGMTQFDGQNVLYRSDTKAPLSIVSPRYKAVQPADVLEFFRTLMEQNGFQLHTAGTLFGGKRMWALANTGSYSEVVDGDGVGAFLLLTTSADRKLATTARFTSVRVVCNNTLSMATNSKATVSLPHSSEFNIAAMHDKLEAAVDTFGTFMKMSRAMAKAKMSNIAVDSFLTKLFDIPHNETLKDNRASAKVLELFLGDAKGADMAGQTRWGMMNAVTEYFDHWHPARTADARLNSAWYGRNDRMKSRAMELLAA